MWRYFFYFWDKMRRQQPLYFDGIKSVPLDQLPEEAWRVIAGAGEGTLDTNVISGDILAHYAAVAFLYRCVQVRASALAGLPWAVLRGEDVVWESNAEDAPAQLTFLAELPELLLRSEMALCLFGRAFWHQERNRVRVLGLRWLTPYYVTPIWDEATGLIRFDRTVNGVIVPLAVDDVVYLRLPGQHETLPDIPPSRAALAAAGVLKNVDAFAENFFLRGAIKGTLLTVDGNPAPQEKEKLKTWWNRFLSGVKNAWQTEVISSKVTPVTVGEGIQELSSTTLTAEKREDIATALGVPHSLVLSNAANYATSEADRLNFYDMTVIPQSKQVARQINRQLLEPLGYRLQFRPEEMSIYQADEQARSQSYSQYVTAGMRPSIAGEMLGLSLPDGVEYAALDEKFDEPEPMPDAEIRGDTRIENSEESAFTRDNPRPDPEARQEEAKRLRRWLKKRPGVDVAQFKSVVLTDAEKALIAASLDDDLPGPGGAGQPTPFCFPANYP